MSLNPTSMPGKWHVNLLNGLSMVHDYDIYEISVLANVILAYYTLACITI